MERTPSLRQGKQGHGTVPCKIVALRRLAAHTRDARLIKINKAVTRDYRRRRKAEKAIKEATANRSLGVSRHLPA